MIKRIVHLSLCIASGWLPVLAQNQPDNAAWQIVGQNINAANY